MTTDLTSLYEGGMQSRRHNINTEISDISVTTYGRPNFPHPSILPNPGATDKDPVYAEKIASLAWTEGTNLTIHLTSDHSGAITLIDDLGNYFAFNNGEKTELEKPDLPEAVPPVLTFPGDGVICSKALPSFISMAIRTCDCPPIAFTSPNWFGGVHLSVDNLFNFHRRDNFSGSILKNLFQLISPEETSIAVGPSVGGSPYPAKACWHYEYTETPDQRDGSRLIESILAEYPDFDLQLFVLKLDGKYAFQWGRLIQSLLQHHGVQPDKIDSVTNICTMCNTSELYSNRFARATGRIKEIENRYGNITIIRRLKH